VPYARKIEMGHGKMTLPGHVYEDAALIVWPLRQPGRGQVHLHAGPVRRGAGLRGVLPPAAAWQKLSDKARQDWLVRQPALEIRDR
jgi:hypothetical protein